MYPSFIFNIFISTPSDTQNEILKIEDSIEQWNTFNSKSEGIMLKSLMWGKDTYPITIGGLEGRPQGIINKQLLEESDILIGVFWTRIGTPTIDENGVEYVSGSAEEIAKHIKAGKPAMLFFSKAKPDLEKLGKKEMIQYEKLLSFKKEYRQFGLVIEFGENENPFLRSLSLLMKGKEIKNMIQRQAYWSNYKLGEFYKTRFKYQFEAGMHGLCTWHRETQYLWREERPGLPIKNFVVVSEEVIYKTKGFVVHSFSKDDNEGFQIFIPNRGEKDMMLYWRIINKQNNTWKQLGISAIEYF
ncbi:hypothetical protein D0T84_20400 [Dysgonomonas sp. 521]|uniref:hypothetical protein n=1 Tax=Dysgonomonas sp. 521 TaxID=2302932 RepID=UPI0013D380C6|nr:hypothetical protein [Dysgonomonas sp. 521]NDV97244.1 hypothetical protein [Dysgonomonas sp. 521]